MPEYVWDNKKDRFRGPIMLLVNGVVQVDRSISLNDGDTVILKKILVGG